MKKLLKYLISGVLMFFSPLHCENLTDMQERFDNAVGTCASDGIATGIGVSMMGWGLAIIVGISILSVVIHQSNTQHTSPTSTQGGTGSGVGQLL